MEVTHTNIISRYLKDSIISSGFGFHRNGSMLNLLNLD